MVLQDTWLFGGTVADNVAYGKPEATREEIVTAAATRPTVTILSARCPQGYDTVVERGFHQHFRRAEAAPYHRPGAAARTGSCSSWMRRPPMWIPARRYCIQKAMDKLMRGRTCFVIAHRLSTIVDADLILVINDGQIVEAGTHEGLLEKQGFYYRLYTSQYAV